MYFSEKRRRQKEENTPLKITLRRKITTILIIIIRYSENARQIIMNVKYKKYRKPHNFVCTNTRR